MSGPTATPLRELILDDIDQERERQITKWGVQHRKGVDSPKERMAAYRDRARGLCDRLEKAGPRPGYTGGASWEAIIMEELFEALAEPDGSVPQRKELIQACAVLVAWIEDLDKEV